MAGSRLLDDMKRAARAKARADTRYRAAVAAAVAEHGYAAAARTLGVSRQAVRQLTLRS